MVAGYESVASLTAWKDMRGMKLHPKDAPDSEGRVMCGDELHRNIVAWKNPESLALSVVNFNGERNDFDRNLYWHYGQPLLTGQHKFGAAIGGNLAPNPELQGERGQLPNEWSWQIRPRPDARAALTEDGLRIDAALNRKKQRDNYPIVASREFELQPGKSYHLRVKLRTDRPTGKAETLVQCWIPPHDGKPAHFWGSYPANAAVNKQWKDFDFHFIVPREGEKGWHPEMKNFCIRFDWSEPEGALFVKDVVLEQVQALDEWASWQAMGCDRHSLIADPQFVAPEKDDYRLQPGSPAFKLGFQPIPVEKIGPYADPSRATWPIVEAEGAREHPPGGAR
jgi:hypothetical protein